MSKHKGLTFLASAERVLRDAGEPLTPQEITQRALDQDLLRTTGKTPEATLAALFSVDLRNEGDKSRFVKVRPGVFGLRRWVEEGRISIERSTERGKVRVPHFPRHTSACGALQAWEGLTRSAITGMRAAIVAITGTPQENLDWRKPDEWIDQRLTGEPRETAWATWKGSRGAVNPRHTIGVWTLLNAYDLLVDGPGGVLAISPAGNDFLSDSTGRTVQHVDELEGLLALLSLVSEIGPAARKDLIEPWTEFLRKESRVQAASSVRSYLWARLRNLHLRGLIEKVGVKYAATDAGIAYLRDAGVEQEGGDTPIHELIHQELKKARETLRELLSDIDPFAFEHLIKDLLEAMNYQDVEVTPPSGDKGVDVIASIELGITAVKEVVQVKRHQKPIQRRVLDALRGSLHRFDAVRGTIITIGGFAKGTREAAFEPGAPPITLIDGDKLIDLLIEHGIGVKKREIELLEVDPDAFRPPVEEEDVE